MDDVPDAPRTATRPPFRRLAVVLAVWVAAAGGALLLASALDSPVGEGARDAAQPAVPGPIASPAEGQPDLPPLALVLHRPPPADVVSLPPLEQVSRLQDLAAATGEARRFVELGSVLQALGAAPGAQSAYRQALERDPQNVGARVGLALGKGATAGGTAQLQALARERPRDQLVAFNTGWLEIYRGRAEPARRALQRTIALGAGTRLGQLAARLLATLVNGAGGRNP